MEPLIIPTERKGGEIRATEAGQRHVSAALEPYTSYAMSEGFKNALRNLPTTVATENEALFSLTDTSYGQIPQEVVPDQPKLSVKQLQETYGSDIIKWDSEYTAEQADYLIERKRNQLQNAERQERTTGFLRNTAVLGAELSAAALDPLSMVVGTGIQPLALARPLSEVAGGKFFAGINKLRVAAQMPADILEALVINKAGQITARGIGARAAVMAGDNLIASALIEGYNVPANLQLKADYDTADALVNIAGGTAFGAMFGLGSGLARRFNWMPDSLKNLNIIQHNENMQTAVAQAAMGYEVNLTPVMDSVLGANQRIGGAEGTTKNAPSVMRYNPKNVEPIITPDIKEYSKAQIDLEGNDIEVYKTSTPEDIPVSVKDPETGAEVSLREIENPSERPYVDPLVEPDVIPEHAYTLEMPAKKFLYKEGQRLSKQSKEVQGAMNQIMEDFGFEPNTNNWREIESTWGADLDTLLQDYGVKGKLKQEGDPLVYDVGDIALKRIYEHEPVTMREEAKNFDPLLNDKLPAPEETFRATNDVPTDYETIPHIDNVDALLDQYMHAANQDVAQAWEMISAGNEPHAVTLLKKLVAQEELSFRTAELENKGIKTIDALKENPEVLSWKNIEDPTVREQYAKIDQFENNLENTRNAFRQAIACLIKNGH